MRAPVEELPAEALVAEVQNYGGDAQDPFNGTVVEVGAFLADANFFEVTVPEDVLVRGQTVFYAGEVVYAAKVELRPLNEATRAYIEAVTEAKADVYSDAVYDLRDMLAAAGIAVTAAAVAAWSAEQLARVERWVAYIRDPGDHAARQVPVRKPPELP